MMEQNINLLRKEFLKKKSLDIKLNDEIKKIQKEISLKEERIERQEQLMKNVQLMGQNIGEVLKQLDDDRCKIILRKNTKVRFP